MEGFQEFFRQTFDKTPYPYQERVASDVMQDKNVVLVAPTGAGKTWAALAPFLYSKKIGKPTADRVIYALPLRSLASSLHQSTKEVVEEKFDLKVTLQMGNQPDDPFFQGDIVFTTIDQLLSAYIGLAFGTSSGMSNIPPGALIGAQVVIDEFHLLPYKEALLTFLEMMKRLRLYTQFFVMTATAPDRIVNRISDHLRTVPMKLSDMNQLQRTREIHWHDSTLSADAVLSQRGVKTLVVVNTVGRAQQLYLELRSRIEEANLNIAIDCLHSRMFEQDRRKMEQRAHDRFAREAKDPSILVATQVVEVGLDISANVLLTDLCPANALLQRAGRCARFADEHGTVHVYKIQDETGNILAKPYDLERLELTEGFLKNNTSCMMSHDFEQSILEWVHGELDVEQLENVFLNLLTREDDVNRFLVAGEGNAGDLIRDITNISVLVHPNPLELRLENKPARVSVSTSTLYGVLKQVLDHKESNEVIGWYPVYSKEETKVPGVTWEPIQSLQDLRGCTLVCLSPEAVNYQRDVGLLLPPMQDSRQSILSEEQLSDSDRTFEPFSYVRETYLEHVERIRSLYQQEEQSNSHQVANTKLSKYFQSRDGEKGIARLAELTGALHDVGKLSKKYQDAVRAWQTQYKQKPEQEFLAHTDYNAKSRADREESKKKLYERGNHAVEGALMSIVLLNETACWFEEYAQEDVLVALLLSIMRHHYAYSDNFKSFTIASQAELVVKDSLHGLIEGGIELNAEPEDLSSLKNHLRKSDVLTLYWYLVRRLRLNDQRSQYLLQQGKGEENGIQHKVDIV